jgi:GMP synthase (glutamine-hydrolysing)
MKKTIYGLQWHPEVVHTEHGKEMLRNFIFEVCKCKANWRPSSFIDEQIDEIKKTIDGGKAIIALSGGIDSSTAMHACILIPESASHSSTCISPLSFSTSSDSCSILKMGYTFLSLKYIVAGVK